MAAPATTCSTVARATTTSAVAPARTGPQFGKHLLGGNQLCRPRFELGHAAKNLLVPRLLDFGRIILLIGIQTRDQDGRQLRPLVGGQLHRLGFEPLEWHSHIEV